MTDPDFWKLLIKKKHPVHKRAMIVQAYYPDFCKLSVQLFISWRCIRRLNLRYALKKKKRYYLGIFPKRRTPLPFGNPLSKKKILCLYWIVFISVY